jgi:AAA domain
MKQHANSYAKAFGRDALREEMDGAQQSYRGDEMPPNSGDDGDPPGPRSKLIDGLIFQCIADVEPQPVEWLWPSPIARGKVTLSAGDPSVGKTLIAIDIIARTSTGRALARRRPRAHWERRHSVCGGHRCRRLASAPRGRWRQSESRARPPSRHERRQALDI